MKINYSDTITLTMALNDIVVQEVSISSAVLIAEFAGALTKALEDFEEKRGKILLLETEEAKEKQFHLLLAEEVELPDSRFSILNDVKFKATLVVLLKRLNLW